MKKYLLILAFLPLVSFGQKPFLPDSIVQEVYHLYLGVSIFCDYTITHNEEIYEIYSKLNDSTVMKVMYTVRDDNVNIIKLLTKHYSLPVCFFDFNYMNYPSSKSEVETPNGTEKKALEIVQEMVSNKISLKRKVYRI